MLHNGFWKESRDSADWVVVTAIDEHLHLPGRSIRDYLWQCTAQRVTCIPGLGYQMVSEEFPEPGEFLCETTGNAAIVPSNERGTSCIPPVGSLSLLV